MRGFRILTRQKGLVSGVKPVIELLVKKGAGLFVFVVVGVNSSQIEKGTGFFVILGGTFRSMQILVQPTGSPPQILLPEGCMELKTPFPIFRFVDVPKRECFEPSLYSLWILEFMRFCPLNGLKK